MTRGETVKCVVDYDLFDKNIKGEEGCFVKYSDFSKKYLIWFPCNGEWAELKEQQFKLVNKPGYVSKKFQDFVSNIRTLEYSFPT